MENRWSSPCWHLIFYCFLLTVLNAREPDEWVIRMKGGSKIASLLAIQSGYLHVGPVLGFEDTYLWRAMNSKRYKKARMPYAIATLQSHIKIISMDRQEAVIRHKRDYNTGALFNDELWNQEWYLERNTTKMAETSKTRLDLNVLPAYRLGVTGRGIRIAVLDDGLEYTHEDLRNNYDPEISYDITDRDDNPIPRYEEPEMNGHGTRCAGEIAMEADNRKCGVGVAFEARIGGVKMLDGIVNDRVEAEALGYRVDLVDIYTASWGPPDDGKSLEAPGKLAIEAIERGILQGRRGRGSIYVWASGNGGSQSDDCGCDGYVSSVFTLAIASASQAGSFPWYGEMCSATIATTYSSGANQEQMIATTDLKNTCTTSHTGTSASAPLAAGILALALQANENLTWRDVQHLVVYTSEHGPLRENPGWFKNTVGLWFNPRFGFGLMDAYAIVTASFNWTNVPEKTVCTVPSTTQLIREVSYDMPQMVQFQTDGCNGTFNEIQYLEHVQIEINVQYTLRGALQMHLTAPTGTRVQLLNTRKNDDSTDGFIKWKFMSVATWGENPKGTWSLDIFDKTSVDHECTNYFLSKFISCKTKFGWVTIFPVLTILN